MKFFKKELLTQVKNLPEIAGVYLFHDKEKEIIYIGKAKNLKKRVSSYFTKTHTDKKTQILVNRIDYFEFIVVETEEDALLLENNLIKKYRPPYNILLKDDKTFPFICIKNENFPRVFSIREIIKNEKSIYFGPYTSEIFLRILLDLFKKLYQIRTCNFNLSKENINKNKFKPCLEYHIKNCQAPCKALQTEKNYLENISKIKKILKGNLKDILNFLQKEMLQYAKNLEFEKAQIIKEKINILNNYQKKSTVVNPKLTNIDVFSIINDEKIAFVNFLKITNGAVIQVYTTEIQKKLNETKEEILQWTIIEIRRKFYSNTNEVIVPFALDFKMKDIQFHIPQKGDKKLLLDLSLKNLKYFRQAKLKQYSKFEDEKNFSQIILKNLKKDLHLKDLPIHIECFDNSNLQGSNPVASCVVFKNAKPSKKDYRHYNIKTVEGINDFASMEEIIFRRYKHLLRKNQFLPQLIIVDGGKGQLSSAVKSLQKLNLYGKIAIIGIAKKLEEIFFPNDKIPLYLSKTSSSLKLIQQARNEAHRFAITFHRQKRSKNTFRSDLDKIKGIGEKTIEKLLTHFKSVEKIKQANHTEIEELIGKAKTKIIKDFFEEK